jgi:hypothetical protein
MSQCLPTGGFKWVYVEDNHLDYWKHTIWNYKEDSSIGYILMVDLKYPSTLHDKHNELPLAPEHRGEKLMCTLYDKEKYVIHIKNLQLYLELGMEITKIHKILQFKQSRWLKKYIDFNTKCRAEAKNDFEKAFLN